LWLLVLLKLCTPPLFRVPLGWLLPVATASVAPVGPQLQSAPTTFVPVAPEAAFLAGPATVAPEPIATFDPTLLLASAWLAGSLAVLALSIVRARRLGGLLRHTRPASATLREEAAILCRRLGIGRAPELALVPGCVTPMLWAWPFRARILLPEDLCARM